MPLNPANYAFEVRDGKRVPVGFQWPEVIERRNAEDLRRIGAKTTVMSLPQRCRDRLNAAQPLPQEQITQLWQYLQSMEGNRARLPTRRFVLLLPPTYMQSANVAVRTWSEGSLCRS